MQETMIKPDIYAFFNYREYLSALFNYHKALSPVFSHRYIVTKAGYKSPNSLKNVINGQRHLSVEGAEKFAAAFKMDVKERVYFVMLVKFNSAESQVEKEQCFAELLKLRKISSPVLLKNEQVDILSAWYHVAIREITALPDFKNSSLWISRVLNPPISHYDAAQSLKLLKNLGFIKKTQKGWEQVEQVMQSDPEVYHVYASLFHREMIRLGMESISRFPHEDREISGTTLRISRSDISRVKKLLQNFRRQLLDFAASSENADQVYQLNFQFFPLVKQDRPQRVKKEKTGNRS
jgi:uncharacterized protein (TIGR02147 family)